MRFAKRFRASFSGEFALACLDYKGLKKLSKKLGVGGEEALAEFDQLLREELEKVDRFYADREAELEATMAALTGKTSFSPRGMSRSNSGGGGTGGGTGGGNASAASQIAALRRDARALQRFASLNYVAVLKAVKKRDRRLAEAAAAASETAVAAAAAAAPLSPSSPPPPSDSGAAPRPDALRALSATRFFSSTRLAAVATAAEVAAAEAAMGGISHNGGGCDGGNCDGDGSGSGCRHRHDEGEEEEEDFSCPVCLDLLSQPVVLSCGHRFCWGCAAATAGAAVASRQRREQEEEEGRKRAKKLREESESSEGESSAPSSPSSVAALSLLRGKPPLSPSSPTYWGCPVCRKPHALLPTSETGEKTVERGTAKASSSISSSSSSVSAIAGFSLGLEVDPHLERLVLSLSSSSSKRKNTAAAAAAAASDPAAAIAPSPSSPPAFLLPPRDPERHPTHSHPLTVVLDLDGTLIASYPPSRAGALLAPRGDGGSSGQGSFKPPAAFLVGQGSRLNPSGVLVLERPGLGEFLARLSEFAEVVLFTAGLEDYASPIAEALEARHGPTAVPPRSHRLFRCSTTPSRSYPCVKDLSRLGRDPRTTVLVEDTALAGLAQPDSVVPVMPWRGGGGGGGGGTGDNDAGEGWDDRILVEAVLPLLRGLAERATAAATGQARPASPPEDGETGKTSSSSSSAPTADGSASSSFDVRTHLARRFGLRGWFRSQGVVAGEEAMLQMEAEEEENVKASSAMADAPSSSRRRGSRSSPSSTSSASSSSSRLPAVAEEEEEEEEEVEEKEEECNSSSSSSAAPLCVFDFDHTLIDFDSAEEVVSQLAPELAPMLTSLTMPADFIPLTNAVAAEAARRGVREAHWLAALADTGRRGLLLGSGGGKVSAAAMAKDKVGGGGAGVLRAAAAGGAEVRILSDANDLFIAAMLRAAGLGPEAGVVSGVVTNRARFVSTSSSTSTSTTPRSGSSSAAAIAPSPPPSRLVVEPRHDASRLGPHGCRLCPTNLCKGLELRRLVVGGGGGGGEGGGRERDSPAAAARRRAGVAISSSSSSSSLSSSRSRRRRTVIYAGDGENDLCPALNLKGGDSLLVRRGRGLERLLRERVSAKETGSGNAAAAFLRQHSALSRAFDASLSSALGQEGARAFVWDSAEELRSLVEALLLLCEDDRAGGLL